MTSVIISAACRSPRDRITHRARRSSAQAVKQSSAHYPPVEKVLPVWRENIPILKRD
jgi:hypothetical protein